jgi:hypothetical protein
MIELEFHAGMYGMGDLVVGFEERCGIQSQQPL